ncbi:hypothetical protein AALP_AAs48476U000100, partial [Arabis alpina]
DMAKVVDSDSSSGGSDLLSMSLDSIRELLIRQEDTIVFSLIERSKFEESRCLDSVVSSSLASKEQKAHDAILCVLNLRGVTKELALEECMCLRKRREEWRLSWKNCSGGDMDKDRASVFDTVAAYIGKLGGPNYSNL